jgi:hypothetical protein
MSIRATSEKHTIGWLLRKSIENALDFTIAIQRKEVWDDMHKSNLIASVLLGVPIESLLFEEDGEDGYLVLDAKQRSLTFISFLKDGFAISDKCKVPEINGVGIIGKKFSELPVNMQEKIKECELPISVMRPLTEEEREIVFFMRNQQVPLTKVELTRVNLGSGVMTRIEQLATHPFMSKVNLSVSKTNRYQDQQVILEILMEEMRKEYSHSGADLMEFAKELRKEGISELVEKNIVKIFDFMNKAYPQKNSKLRKTHISTLYVVASKAIDADITEEWFAEWTEKFFADIKGEINDYTEACNAGVNTKQSIVKRKVFANNHFDNYKKIV